MSRDWFRTPFKRFGETRSVQIMTYTNGNIDKPARRPWSKEKFFEFHEDHSSYLTAFCHDETVLVITRSNWESSPKIEVKNDHT